jgi:hypothetical protein
MIIILRLPILTQSMIILVKIILLFLFLSRPVIHEILFITNLFKQVIKHLN